MSDKLLIVGKVLDHALLGAEILLREAGDWNGQSSYGGRLWWTVDYLKKAQTEFRAAGEEHDLEKQMREVMNRTDKMWREMQGD